MYNNADLSSLDIALWPQFRMIFGLCVFLFVLLCRFLSQSRVKVAAVAAAPAAAAAAHALGPLLLATATHRGQHRDAMGNFT